MLADSVSHYTSPLRFPSYFNCFLSLVLSGLYLFILLSPHWGASSLKSYSIGFFQYCSPDPSSPDLSQSCSYSSPADVPTALRYCSSSASPSSSSNCDTIKIQFEIGRPVLIALSALQFLAALFYVLPLIFAGLLTHVNYNRCVSWAVACSAIAAFLAAGVFGLAVDMFEQQFDSTFQMDYASWIALGASFGSLASAVAGAYWNKAKVKEQTIQFDADYLAFR